MPTTRRLAYWDECEIDRHHSQKMTKIYHKPTGGCLLAIPGCNWSDEQIRIIVNCANFGYVAGYDVGKRDLFDQIRDLVNKTTVAGETTRPIGELA